MCKKCSKKKNEKMQKIAEMREVCNSDRYINGWGMPPPIFVPYKKVFSK